MSLQDSNAVHLYNHRHACCQQEHAVKIRQRPSELRKWPFTCCGFAPTPEMAIIAGGQLCRMQYAGSFEAKSSALEQALFQLGARKRLPQGQVRPVFQYGPPGTQVSGNLSDLWSAAGQQKRTNRTRGGGHAFWRVMQSS